MQRFSLSADLAADGLSQLRSSVRSGAKALLACQHPHGVIIPEQKPSPVNTALASLALHLVDPSDPDGLVDRAVTYLCRTQNAEGGWSSHQFQSEMLATAHVVDVLRIVAPERAASTIAAAADLLDCLGRPENSLAWVRARRHERSLLSPPMSLQTLPAPRIPLTLGAAQRRLSLRLPAYASIAMRSGGRRTSGSRTERSFALSFIREIYEHEGATGAFGGDPWLTSQICIGLTRSGLASDMARRAAEWLRSQASPQGTWPPASLDVRWASLVITALVDGDCADDTRLRATRDMLHRTQQSVPFPSHRGRAGGWSPSGTPSWPTAQATAEAVSALSRLSQFTDNEQAKRGADWLVSQQDSRGSWSLAVRNSSRGPYGPCAHLTAQAVRALLDSGLDSNHARVAKALRWLSTQQDEDGSFTSLWYRGNTMATSAVIEAFHQAGRTSGRTCRRALDWLARAQRSTGAWSASQDAGVSTVEETASALSALLQAGLPASSVYVTRAVQWLVNRQRTDGTWPAEPVNEYIRLQCRFADELIATSLAVRALGLFARKATSPEEQGTL